MKFKLLHKVVSILIIITFLFTIMPITTVSATENTTIYFEMPQHWIDEYGTTPGEKTTSVFCYIYTVGGSDPDFKTPSWQSKSTKLTYDDTKNLYYIDIPTKYKQELKYGCDYCVIFSAKSSVTNANPQCYALTFGTQCYGDTVYITETVYEDPSDSSKKSNAAYWRKPENAAIYGPHAGITSLGVLQGEVFAPGEDKALAVANYIAKFPDNIITNPDPNVCVTLCTSAGVMPYYVYSKYENTYATDISNGIVPDLYQVASWLDLSYPPEVPTEPPTTEPITEPPTTAPITTEPITKPSTTVPGTTAPVPTTVPDTTAPATTVPATTSPFTTEPIYRPTYTEPLPDNYYTPITYVPSHDAMEVGQNRYFFLLPDDWTNEYTYSAGAYWWDGTDACGSLDVGIKWPGYRINQFSANTVTHYYTDKDGTKKSYTGTVWYVDVPRDVTTIIFTNAMDGGDKSWYNYSEDIFLKAKNTVDIGAEYYDYGESDNYPEGTESFNNMIYIIDPTQTVVNPLNGKSAFAGEWYYYHGGDKWDTALNPTYGGTDGEKPGEPYTPIEPTEPINPIGDTEIRFEKPTSWKNVKQMYCHIWMPIDDGSVKWPSWKSKVEKMTDNGDGTWTYDVSKIGSYVIRPEKGASYCVIFAADTGMQTYNLLMDADCLGDTAYVTGNLFENPEDSNKTITEARWFNSYLGPEKKILSGGNGIVGDTLPEGVTDARLMANWLKVYYWDVYKTQNVDTLLTKLNVTGQEVYDEIVILTETEDESTKDKIRSSCAELLGVGNTPTYSDTFVVFCTNKTTGEELKAFMSFNSETGEAEYTFTDLKADKYSFRVVDVENLINLGTVNTGFSGNDSQSIKVVFDSNTGDVFTEVIITEKVYSQGDVDHDGEVTIKDATSVQSHIARYLKNNELDLTLADMNNDGEVNILDATKLQMIISKLV